ncbi:MAG: ABC transporter substrate-binding protein [Solirubrobacteraceae bacterium MAG38_C4-C5]|nr:ABC transporter substrate-binding protein [Candidatus Siliceabacter maunaloa]
MEPIGVGDPVLYEFLPLPGDIEDVGQTSGLNLERIAALRPDLIVGLDLEVEESYEQLTQVAPTVGVVFGESTGNWKATGAAVAEVLGEREQYARLLAEYEERARALGRELGGARAATVAVMRAGENLRFELPGISGSILYRDVGLPLPQGLRAAAEAGEANLQISREQFRLGRRRRALRLLRRGEPRAGDRRGARGPAVPGLDAVRSNNVHAVGQQWFNGNVLAANLVLDDLERFLGESAP